MSRMCITTGIRTDSSLKIRIYADETSSAVRSPDFIRRKRMALELFLFYYFVCGIVDKYWMIC